MSSVGYGDIVPKKPSANRYKSKRFRIVFVAVGRVIGSITLVVGVMVLALPVSTLVQNFTEQMDEHTDDVPP